MKQRNSSNSEVLQKRFPQIYREFFSKCQIVTSAPHFFTWAGEYVGYYGGVMVLQKLPFRIYIGLEFLSNTSEQKAVIASNSVAYSQKENKFKKDQYEHLAQERLLDFANTYLSKSSDKRAVKIHILSELPLGGSGSAGALCSAMALALQIKENKISVDALKKWETKETTELIENKKLKFNSAFRLAWKMMASYRGKETSGATVFASLLPSKYPVFYNLKLDKDISLPLNINGDYSLIDKIDFQGGRINELFKIPQNPSWPIDFGLIYLGEPRGTAPFPTCQLKDDMEDTTKFLKQHFEEQNNFNKNLWSQGLGVMNFLSTQVLMNLGQILESGARENALRDFLRAIDKHQILFSLLGLLPKTVDSVTSIVHHKARALDDLGAGLKSVSTTKKDIILFAFPHSRVREVISKTLPVLEKELNIETHLGYASWLDGIESRGVVVEQSLEKKIYSNFVSKNAVSIREFSGKGDSNTLLLTPEEFENKKHSVDVLVEQKKGKIYVRGELLTSKDIHSSRATIGILNNVLEQRGKEVSCRELPNSSYSLDRYELQGKITSPLIKAITKRGGKKFPLTIKGGVADFKIKLDFGDYIIWLKD